jgi:hypothetical protein
MPARLALISGSPSLSLCSSRTSFSVMRCFFSQRARFQMTSATAMAARNAPVARSIPAAASAEWSRMRSGRKPGICHIAVTAEPPSQTPTPATTRTLARFFRNSTSVSAENSRLNPSIGEIREAFGFTRSPATTVSPWTMTPKSAASTMTTIAGARMVTAPITSMSLTPPRSRRPARPVPTSIAPAPLTSLAKSSASRGKTVGAR